MIYTIISLNDVFYDAEIPYIITEHSGYGYSEYCTLNGEKHLRRLFSTRPQDYLRLK